MLDVQVPQKSEHTWTEFFIHIGTIAIGLLISIVIEQIRRSPHNSHKRQHLREALNHESRRILLDTEHVETSGIGPVVATAIVAAIGNGAAFRKGREFAAWLGIVPRQYSTGGKAKLLGISKRGNVYLRKILIHGARAAVLRIKRDRAPIGAWLDRLDARAHKNVVIVAMANKLARIAWAVLSSGNEYRFPVSVAATP